jgi:hypothetical protein
MDELSQLFGDESLAVQHTKSTWFMYDGAPAYFARDAERFLDSY